MLTHVVGNYAKAFFLEEIMRKLIDAFVLFCLMASLMGLCA